MRHYEIMLLIHPDQSERARVMMDRYVGIIEGGQGQVHRNEDLGRRMLAYPIAKVQKAHYMLMNVECGRETLDELVGALHFSDAVLRHLVIRRDDAVAEQSVLARAVEKEAARENREYPYDREVAHQRRARRDGGRDAEAKPAADAAPKAEDAGEDAAEADAGAARESSDDSAAAAPEPPDESAAAADEPAQAVEDSQETEQAGAEVEAGQSTEESEAETGAEQPTEKSEADQGAEAPEDAPADDSSAEDAPAEDAPAGKAAADPKEEKE